MSFNFQNTARNLSSTFARVLLDQPTLLPIYFQFLSTEAEKRFLMELSKPPSSTRPSFNYQNTVDNLSLAFCARLLEHPHEVGLFFTFGSSQARLSFLRCVQARHNAQAPNTVASSATPA